MAFLVSMHSDPTPPFRLLPNPLLDRTAPYSLAEQWILNRGRHLEVMEEISSWPGYEPTPLLDLRPLAKELAIGRLSLKNEGAREPHSRPHQARQGAATDQAQGQAEEA